MQDMRALEMDPTLSGAVDSSPLTHCGTGVGSVPSAARAVGVCSGEEER